MTTTQWIRRSILDDNGNAYLLAIETSAYGFAGLGNDELLDILHTSAMDILTPANVDDVNRGGTGAFALLLDVDTTHADIDQMDDILDELSMDDILTLNTIAAEWRRFQKTGEKPYTLGDLFRSEAGILEDDTPRRVAAALREVASEHRTDREPDTCTHCHA